MSEFQPLIDMWVDSFVSLKSFVVLLVGLALGLLNVKYNFVDRDHFFAKLLRYYLFAALLLSLPLLAGYLFGGDAAILGGLPIFIFGPLLFLLYPQAVALVCGFVVATIARDTIFEAN